MLLRTVDNLYWLPRYVERAEYIARILDTTLRLTTLPLAYAGATNEWESAVATAGCAGAFSAHYSEANEETVTEFLCFSRAPMRGRRAPPSPWRCGTRSTAPGCNSSGSATGRPRAKSSCASCAGCR